MNVEGKMKRIILIIVAIASVDASAVTISKNIPGLNVRDLTASSIIIEPDGQIYRSVPGLPDVKDISQPSQYIDGDTIYPSAIPGLRVRDYTDSSWTVDDDQ
jgi:hypothetical protein